MEKRFYPNVPIGGTEKEREMWPQSQRLEQHWATSQGIYGVSRDRKRQGKGFPLRIPEVLLPHEHLYFFTL